MKATKVEGIILAAGLSTRTGAYKLALEIQGKAIIERCIESMYDTCSQITVVGGYRIDIISEILRKYSKVKLVFNASYKDGMYSSVKEGLRHIKEERFFLIPGDYPLVLNETYEEMLTIDRDIVIPTYNGRKGHPILIKSYLINEILIDNRYTNLREFTKAHEFSTMSTRDPGILIDVDTMEDYSNIIKGYIPQCDLTLA